MNWRIHILLCVDSLYFNLVDTVENQSIRRLDIFLYFEQLTFCFNFSFSSFILSALSTFPVSQIVSILNHRPHSSTLRTYDLKKNKLKIRLISTLSYSLFNVNTVYHGYQWMVSFKRNVHMIRIARKSILISFFCCCSHFFLCVV